jgi:hypothetical protein
MEVSGQLHTLAALRPGKRPPVPTVQRAVWGPEPVWTLRRKISYSYRDIISDLIYYYAF